MLAILKRFGNIRGQQQELGITLGNLLHLYRGFERFAIESGLKVGAQTGFC
jgi:hypothetical protein